MTPSGKPRWLGTRVSSELRPVLGARLRAQHLIGPPAPSVADAVHDALAMQSQDPPLARFSIALRTGLSHDDEVVQQLGSGEVLRTHVLRPTWHYVHRDDVRWLLRLTGPKIISGTASRHRQLGIDDQVRDEAFSCIQRALSDGQTLTRKQLHPLLPVTGFARQGQVVGHLLFLAEMDALIASGPSREGEQTYRLMDEIVPEDTPLPSDEAAVHLVQRFVAGRGPSSVHDIQRWCVLAKGQITTALRDSDLAHGHVEGVELWWPADAPPRGDCRGTWLLPMYDEAYGCHDETRFPRPAGHRMGHTHVEGAGAGHGVIIVDGRDIGRFVLTGSARAKKLDLELAPRISTTTRAKTVAPARRLAAFTGAQKVTTSVTDVPAGAETT